VAIKIAQGINMLLRAFGIVLAGSLMACSGCLSALRDALIAESNAISIYTDCKVYKMFVANQIDGDSPRHLLFSLHERRSRYNDIINYELRGTEDAKEDHLYAVVSLSGILAYEPPAHFVGSHTSEHVPLCVILYAEQNNLIVDADGIADALVKHGNDIFIMDTDKYATELITLQGGRPAKHLTANYLKSN